MARQKSRKPFPTNTRRSEVENPSYMSNERAGVFGFLSDRGVRETIESIIVAVILALLFRTFEAEAFVIPTGSMAPSLQGQHRDINCDQCGYLYQTGASGESSTAQANNRSVITHTYCPICRFKTTMDSKNWDHTSNNGDRILVNKFVYDFSEPKRFDVIVFKNPNNGKQNYIKRLIGLPNERLVIENGDIFRVVGNNGGKLELEIVRKPSDKLRSMMQLVDDTNFIPQSMHDAKWPLRWQQWDNSSNENDWKVALAEAKPSYAIDETPETSWLRYRNLVPINRRTYKNGSNRNNKEKNEWVKIESGDLPDRMKKSAPMGSLITDFYCYNQRVFKAVSGGIITGGFQYDTSKSMHWVGDLGLECWTNVKSNSGKLKLQLVEGGAKFTCTIDVETGEARLESDHSTVQFMDDEGNAVAEPKASTPLDGTGKYRIMFANVDDQIHLAINNRFVAFDAAKFTRSDRTVPKTFPNDPSNLGDAEPVGIGAENLKLEISRLKVLRDVYYTSPTGMDQRFIENETKFAESFFSNENRSSPRYMRQLENAWDWFEDPEQWESESASEYFLSRFRDKPYVFELGDDQFLPMGDNSPSSLDGRVWGGPKNVERDMLIGRALFIYWPHALNSPVPYFPNFEKMKFIR